MKPRTVALVATAVGLAMSAAAFAQQVSEVVVEAPRAQVTHSSANGIPTEVITIKHRVSYKDIDISNYSGAKVLEQRIKDAAKEACKQIKTLYPNELVTMDESACAQAATADAMVQANTAIAAARKTAGK
jgi:UrcA family protein